MKLRNKKTGETRDFDGINVLKNSDCTIAQFSYDNLAELNEEWEDYREPKDFWYIDVDGDVYESFTLNQYNLDKISSIGNCFETKEEAEKAVEKLKARKRLKDKGFRFRGLGVDNYEIDDIKYEMKEPPITHDCQEMKDLKLLFGGKDE